MLKCTASSPREAVQATQMGMFPSEEVLRSLKTPLTSISSVYRRPIGDQTNGVSADNQVKPLCSALA